MRPAALPSSLGPAFALAALVSTFTAGEARADAHQASLGVRVQVLDTCAANSALGPVSAALAAPCLSAGAVVVLEQPASADGAGAGAPVMSESGPGAGRGRFVTLVFLWLFPPC